MGFLAELFTAYYGRDAITYSVKDQIIPSESTNDVPVEDSIEDAIADASDSSEASAGESSSDESDGESSATDTPEDDLA